MILLQNTLVSEDVIDEHFICDIEKCKGACCIEGDKGAPLDSDEVSILSADYQKIAPFLDEDGRNWIEAKGFYEIDDDGEAVTTCLPDGRCSFVVKESDGSLACGIEKAHYAGASDFLKPVSCHLYPIRVNKYADYHAVNYHRWDICSAACALGDKKGVRIYEFLEASLRRKFGDDWYEELSALAKAYIDKTGGENN